MAILCRDIGLLLLQAPHTGSTSLGTLLRTELGGEMLVEERVRDARGRIVLRQKHQTLAQLIEAGLVTPEQRADLLVVVGVRNPFDLVLTEYARNREAGSISAPQRLLRRLPGASRRLQPARLRALRAAPLRARPALPPGRPPTLRPDRLDGRRGPPHPLRAHAGRPRRGPAPGRRHRAATGCRTATPRPPRRPRLPRTSTRSGRAPSSARAYARELRAARLHVRGLSRAGRARRKGRGSTEPAGSRPSTGSLRLASLGARVSAPERPRSGRCVTTGTAAAEDGRRGTASGASDEVRSPSGAVMTAPTDAPPPPRPRDADRGRSMGPPRSLRGGDRVVDLAEDCRRPAGGPTDGARAGCSGCYTHRLHVRPPETWVTPTFCCDHGRIEGTKGGDA